MSPFEEYKLQLGKRIRGFRATAGMSLRSFGFMTGIHYNQLLHIEQGKTNPSLETLYRIADGLGISVAYLLDVEAIFSEDNDDSQIVSGSSE